MHLPSEHHTVDPSTGKVVERIDECEPPIEDEELAYIRHLENKGWDEAEGHRRWEEEQGVESFADARARSMGYADAAEREASDAQSGYYNELRRNY